jgi:hypothetical protein
LGGVIPLISIMNIVFYIILAWLLYLFIFRLLVPVIRTTRQVRKGFREMKRHMNGHFNAGANENLNQPKSRPEPRPKKGDYIDFEEIQD